MKIIIEDGDFDSIPKGSYDVVRDGACATWYVGHDAVLNGLKINTTKGRPVSLMMTTCPPIRDVTNMDIGRLAVCRLNGGKTIQEKITGVYGDQVYTTGGWCFSQKHVELVDHLSLTAHTKKVLSQMKMAPTPTKCQGPGNPSDEHKRIKYKYGKEIAYRCGFCGEKMSSPSPAPFEGDCTAHPALCDECGGSGEYTCPISNKTDLCSKGCPKRTQTDEFTEDEYRFIPK